jgi:glucokinase
VPRTKTPDSVLALDFGGTQIRTALVLPGGTILGRRASRTPRDAASVVGQSAAQLRETLSEASERGAPAPAELGISAPGPLDPFRGVILTPPNLDRSLWDFPFARAIGVELGLSAVMERDTQVAVLAEGEFGAARGHDNYVYMTVSTGVGGGIVSDGRLLRGADGLAGEIGHITIDLNGPLCGCGMPGHLEAFASGTGIARRAVEAGLRMTDGGHAQAVDVAHLEEQGDEIAAGIMDNARRAFASAVVSIADLFNPSVLVVGGGIAIGQGDRLLDPARHALRKSGYSHQAQRMQIVPAQLGDDVGLVGALSLVGLARLGDHWSLHTSPTR